MSDKFRVAEPTTLLIFLQTHLMNWSRNKIKQRLQSGCVWVNGQSVTQHDYALNIDDAIVIAASIKPAATVFNQLDIIYSDADVVAINKPAGLLSVGTATETQQHALALLRNQLSRRNKPVKLWPVHRLDRDTSGILLFATSLEMREAIMAKWDEAEKQYLAIVEGCPNPASGTINEPLRLDDIEYRMHVGAHPDAKPAVTHFQLVRHIGRRSLLTVQIETGRQHQIRAHLAWLGHPVIGDMRYGTAGPKMGLHAERLSIVKPSGKRLTFAAPAPASFMALLAEG